jgi:hypothetical protein
MIQQRVVFMVATGAIVGLAADTTVGEGMALSKPFDKPRTRKEGESWDAYKIVDGHLMPDMTHDKWTEAQCCKFDRLMAQRNEGEPLRKRL